MIMLNIIKISYINKKLSYNFDFYTQYNVITFN